MEGNTREKTGRNNIRSEKGNKELARAGQCPEEDSMAKWPGGDRQCCS
jgi:hypothetical protein